MLTAVQCGSGGEVSRRFNLAAHKRGELQLGMIGIHPRSVPMAQGGTGVRSDMEFWRDARRACRRNTSPGWSRYRSAGAIETPCQSDALAGAASMTLRAAGWPGS